MEGVGGDEKEGGERWRRGGGKKGEEEIPFGAQSLIHPKLVGILSRL